MYPRRYARRCVSFCLFSSVLILFGIVIISLRTLIYKSVINKIFLLRADTHTYEIWKKNPVPLTLKLYLFNWTNAADVSNSSVKPHFQELGPYTFDETKEKVNITWNKNNTVSFYHRKRWWYNSQRSKGGLSDPVTSINPVVLSTAAAAKEWNYVIKQGLNIFLNSLTTSMSSTHTAGEVLFEGYKDPLLTMANHMPSFGSSSMPEYDKFGWFYTRNDSETFEGHFNMDIGVTGQLGELYSWKYMTQTPYYPEKCGEVVGSAGEFFAGDLKKNSIVKFFTPDLCRYVELEYKEEVLVNGVLGYKYVAGDRFLDNGTKIPENKCFCSGNCMPYGALNISACRYGSPAFVSLPHFNKADPYYNSRIDGLKPDNNRHDFFMVFEPKTGLPLHVSARLQINLLLRPVSGLRMFEKVPEAYIPVLWFEQSVVIPDNMVFYLTILANFEVICLATGVVFIFLSVIVKVCYCYKMCNTNLLKKELVITKEEIPLTHS